jgi:uncharacterized protein involved in exopolysaccharide biosynthesis
MSQITDFPPASAAPVSGAGPGLGRALRWGWPMVVVVALAAVAASLYANSRQVPKYEATAQMLVSPLNQTDTTLVGTDVIRDGGDASQTVNTAAVLVESNQAADATAERLGQGLDMNRVLEAVTVAPVENTSILDVTATAENPRLAADLATEFARSVIRLRRAVVTDQLERRLQTVTELRRQAPEDDYSQRDRLYREVRLLEDSLNSGDPTLKFVQAAALPASPESRSRAIDAALALLGGLLVGLAAIVGIDRLRRPVLR